MSDLFILSIHLESGSSTHDVEHLLEKHLHLASIEKYWRSPFDVKHAVAISSLPADKLQNEISQQTFSANVKVTSEVITSSIIVIIEDRECFGLEDKLKLLFQWERNGGSDVKNVQPFQGPTCFQVEFLGGWDAVLNVCKSRWKLAWVDLPIVEVIPFFNSFGKQNNSENPCSSNAEVSSLESGEGVTTEQGHGNSRASANRFESLDKNVQKYLKRCGLLRELYKKEQDFYKDCMKKIQDMKRINKKMHIPNVLVYLTDTLKGRNKKEDIERDFHCLIEKGHEKKKDGTNFKVTLLITAPVENMNIHLVQGSAHDVIVDAYLHIDDSESDKKREQNMSSSKSIYISAERWDQDRILEVELEKLSKRGISTLAISVASKFGEKLALDDFTENLLQNLKKFFRGKSARHIFLCETQSRALFQAYKYFLKKLARVQAFGNIDENIWKEISPKDFSAQHLSNKIKVVKSVKHNSPKSCLVFLPISQNLDPRSCPHNVQGLQGFNFLENSIKYLQSKMNEEDLDAFCVGNTYALRLSECAPMQVHLYCTQTWTFDVARSIQNSLSSCLSACIAYKDPEVYIYPPGVFPGVEPYPVMFTAKKCLHALMVSGKMLQKISTLHLVVPVNEYYEAFNEVLDAKSSSSPLTFKKWYNFSDTNGFEYKPVSFLEILGEKRNLTDAFDELEKFLHNELEANSFKAELKDNIFDGFIQNLQTAPPHFVTVTGNNKTVKVAGLTRRVVDDFKSNYAQFFKPHRSTPSDSGKTLGKKSDAKPPDSKKHATFEWSSINSKREFELFKKDTHPEIEKIFQEESEECKMVGKWRFDFKHMSCTLDSKRQSFPQSGTMPEPKYLLRKENIYMPNLSMEKGKNNEISESEWKQSSLPFLSKEITFFEASRIEAEKLKQRFISKEKSASSNYKRANSYWHPICEDWAPCIATYGFQKLFSCHCESNILNFYKDPTLILEEGKPQTLLLCDILHDQSSLCKVVDDKHISLFANKLSDADVLPRLTVKLGID